VSRTPEQNRAHVKAWQKANRDTYNKRMREWRAKNRTKVRKYERDRRAKQVTENPERARQNNRTRTLRRYGLTTETWDRLFASQDWCCAICGTAECGDDRWHTDHDDNIGLTAVRGILCVRCNIGLGQFMHDPDRLARAIDYLNRASVELAK